MSIQQNIRFPEDLHAAISAEAERRGKPWTFSSVLVEWAERGGRCENLTFCLAKPMPDYDGRWFAFPDWTSGHFEHLAMADRVDLPSGAVGTMFANGEMVAVTPAEAAKRFGPEHRCWHVYWRGPRDAKASRGLGDGRSRASH